MQIKKEAGNIFFIPLFLSSDFKENVKSYAKYQFPKSGTYAFGRLIEIDPSGGDLIEIFKYIGNIPNSKELITKSGRLIAPIHVSLGFSKKRWQFIFEDKDYDKNIDSDYQNIIFLLGIPEVPKLWQGGSISRINDYNTNQYNEWIVYPPTKVENLIRETK
ncbi:MAG: immunity 26/phosphotriesterase HocA family protein [Prevotellaceae bacterium]|jgi:hypothetical protein|nr:immunity 26/phosphotriesterase HocA family protein [Prevotellaceae bacterium]